MRVGKFRDVIEFLTTVGCTLPDRTLEAFLARYAAVLEPLVAAAPGCAGRGGMPAQLARSGRDQRSARRGGGHLARLRFRPMDHISAYPTSKTDALRQPARQTGGATVFFWGDQRPGGRPGRLGPFRRDRRQRPALAPGDP